MSLSSVDFTREVYVREPSFSEVCKIFSFICYKNCVIIDLAGLVMLENTTKIAGANEKKLKETINTAKWKLDIHSNTFLVNVLLDTALKTHCLFPNETPLTAFPEMVIIKQVKFETDVMENKDLDGWKKFDEK